MAWIESHQELERHPKTLRLMTLMNWNLDETIGKLHRFWWWCVDYAHDGDLRKFDDALIASAVALNTESSKRFVDAMVNCGGEAALGFIDRQPYFRVHGWWDHIGMFLQIKFKSQPEKWQKVRDLYKDISNNGSYNGSNNGCYNSIPNLTKPNITQPDITKDVSPEKAQDALLDAVFLTIPTQKAGEAWEVKTSFLEEMSLVFPTVNVRREIRHARVWCDTNPYKRKTYRGMKRFLLSWLGRAAKTSATPVETTKGGTASWQERLLDKIQQKTTAG